MSQHAWYDERHPMRSWQRLIDVTTWQPHARLSLDDHPSGALLLRVILTVPDTRQPTVTGQVVHTYPLPHEACWQPEDMLAHLRWVFGDIARHESDEWLTVAGQAPYDPHGEPERANPLPVAADRRARLAELINGR